MFRGNFLRLRISTAYLSLELELYTKDGTRKIKIEFRGGHLTRVINKINKANAI